MEETTFLTATISAISLLLISGFTYIASKKINLPYTVMLVLVGLILVPLSKITFFGFIDDFQLTPDILFYVFLPVLLFESSYNINYRDLLKNWRTISGLAVFGLLISTFVISTLLYFIFSLAGFFVPYLVCLLFASLISATDPVAVLSIFKSVGAPKRLALIFEGESLFNDGTSVALFVIILGIIVQGGVIENSILLSGFGSFLSMLIGGLIFGTVSGVLFSKVLGKIQNNEEVEIVITMVSAHFTFLLAEIITHHYPILPISGVIATVISSIIIGNYGRYKITPKVELHMQKFWEFFAFISNSIVFILMGLILSHIDISFADFFPPLIISIFVIMVGRAVSVYIPIGIINRFKIEEHIPLSWQHLLSWGSLRGALALMMVLMIPDDLSIVNWNYSFTVKEFLIVLTIGSIMFTLFIKATSIPFIMRRLGLQQLHKLEEFEYDEGRILINLRVLEKLKDYVAKGYLAKYEHDELLKKYEGRLQAAIISMQELLKSEGKQVKVLLTKALTLHSLSIEKQYLKEIFLHNEIDEKNFKYILRKIEKQIERIEEGKTQLRKASKDDYDIFSQIAIKLYKDSRNTIDVYIRNRARMIITIKVIDELRYLRTLDLGFNNEIFDEIIDIYAEFNSIAEKKKINIFSSHKATLMGIELKLIDKSLFKLEGEILKDMYKKGTITTKLFIKCRDELETEIYKDIRN